MLSITDCCFKLSKHSAALSLSTGTSLNEEMMCCFAFVLLHTRQASLSGVQNRKGTASGLLHTEDCDFTFGPTFNLNWRCSDINTIHMQLFEGRSIE